VDETKRQLRPVFRYTFPDGQWNDQWYMLSFKQITNTLWKCTVNLFWLTGFVQRRSSSDLSVWSKPVNQNEFTVHFHKVLVICFFWYFGYRPCWIPRGIHSWKSCQYFNLTSRCWSQVFQLTFISTT
jgi:hypothetical protein